MPRPATPSPLRALARTLALALALALCASTGACASSVNSSPTDAPPDADAASIDAPTPVDTSSAPDASGRACMTPSDCADLPRPPDEWSGPGMPSSEWSCIVNHCTFELQGGRTCEARADGCLICNNGAALHCPGRGCNFSRTPDLSSLQPGNYTCTRPDYSMVEQCFGDFVRLRDGTICSLRYAPTGAPIIVLACGGCWTSLR